MIIIIVILVNPVVLTLILYYSTVFDNDIDWNELLLACH